MKTRIVLTDNRALTVDTALERVQESFYEALSNGGWVHIQPIDGATVSINPGHVLYLEELSPEAEAAAPNGSRRSRRGRPAAAAR